MALTEKQLAAAHAAYRRDKSSLFISWWAIPVMIFAPISLITFRARSCKTREPANFSTNSCAMLVATGAWAMERTFLQRQIRLDDARIHYTSRPEGRKAATRPTPYAHVWISETRDESADSSLVARLTLVREEC